MNATHPPMTLAPRCRLNAALRPALFALLAVTAFGAPDGPRTPDPEAQVTRTADPGPMVRRTSPLDPSSRDATATRLPAPPPPPTQVPPLPASRLAPLAATAPTARLAAAAQSLAAAAPSTLVLYDTTGPWGWLGELYAQQTAHLVSRFGTWTAVPVGAYVAGQMNAYTAVVYIGSTYDEPLPAAFLADVRATALPVVWMYDNLWQLTAEMPDFAATYGWTWTGFDVSPIPTVRYKDTALDRDLLNGAGLMGLAVSDPAKARILATAQRSDGTTLPWAVQSGRFFYLTEIPFSYVGSNDRYIAFADLLYEVLAPATATRHRALVRLEDVGPDADPAELRAVADLLYARKIPFSVGVYPAYRDPFGTYANGKSTSYDLANRPQVVAALKYLQSRGGTLMMHGYTHQFGKLINPYSGASGDDFEFFLAHVDAANNVVYDGPVPGDSQSWAVSRVKSGLTAFTRAGLALPTTFEVPHYAASAPDYRGIRTLFSRRYDRGLYFGGLLNGTVNHARLNGQFFPYPVRDIYGFYVVPENLGNVEPEWFNNHPPRLPADILLTAEKNLVVRDGFASFYYHPYLGTAMLAQIVDGLKAQGWTFVAASTVTD